MREFPHGAFASVSKGQQAWPWTVASSWEPADSSAAPAMGSELGPGKALSPQQFNLGEALLFPPLPF